MPRRFFRKFAIKRDQFKDRWYLAPFDHLLHDSNLWRIRRKTVVPAFALGLFIAFMPVPGHFVLAALLALAFGINIPVAVLTTLVSNPLTMGPLYYSAYQLGQQILQQEPQEFEFELSMSWLAEKFVTIGQPLMVGCVLLGTVAALAGYFILDMLWRASLRRRLDSQRNRSGSERGG